MNLWIASDTYFSAGRRIHTFLPLKSLFCFNPSKILFPSKVPLSISASLLLTPFQCTDSARILNSRNVCKSQILFLLLTIPEYECQPHNEINTQYFYLCVESTINHENSVIRVPDILGLTNQTCTFFHC